MKDNETPKAKRFTELINMLSEKPIKNPDEHSISYKAEPTVPESSETLDIQLNALKNKKIKAILIPPGTNFPKIPQGMQTTDTDVGAWIYDPLELSKDTIEAKSRDGSYGQILGHVEPKSHKTTKTITAIQDGIEAKSSIVSPQNVSNQVQVLKEQFPQAEIKIGGEKLAKQIINDRVDSNDSEDDGDEEVAPPQLFSRKKERK